MRQTNFPFAKTKLFHGGELANGKRKAQRPLSSKRPVHLVLKANQNIYAHKKNIEGTAKRLATKFQIRVYDFAMGHDHIHLLVKIPRRREYSAFIRSLSALLARMLGKGIWAFSPFTRIANWGRDFLGLKNYLEKNRQEASGVWKYEPRKDWYKRLREA